MKAFCNILISWSTKLCLNSPHSFLRGHPLLMKTKGDHKSLSAVIGRFFPVTSTKFGPSGNRGETPPVPCGTLTFNDKHRSSLLYFKDHLYVPVPTLIQGFQTMCHHGHPPLNKPQSVHLGSQRGEKVGATGLAGNLGDLSNWY